MQPTLFINSAGKTKIPGVVSGIILQSVSFVNLHFHRQREGYSLQITKIYVNDLSRDDQMA